jgi:hypothetical protein
VRRSSPNHETLRCHWLLVSQCSLDVLEDADFEHFTMARHWLASSQWHPMILMQEHIDGEESAERAGQVPTRFSMPAKV